MNKKVLIVFNYYIPSINAGGPVQSIKNIVENLSGSFDFYQFASKKEFKTNMIFTNIDPEKWVKVNNANIYYTDMKKLKIRRILNFIKNNNIDTIYLNSLFSFKYSILFVYLKKTGIIKQKVIVAPRGSLSPGALEIGSFKKKVYLKFSNLFNIYSKVSFHATNDIEKKFIQKELGIKKENIFTASNLVNEKKVLNLKEKERNKLKLTFLSRIHPKKNLLFALETLNLVDGDVTFDIYGPIEDEDYWGKCVAIINNLPKNIQVNYKGIVSNELVPIVFSEYDAFFFPTLGENFGHVIYEAISSGCVSIISDQTPWNDLCRYNAGIALSLSEKKEFASYITKLINLDNNEFTKLKLGAIEYSQNEINNKKQIEIYKENF